MSQSRRYGHSRQQLQPIGTGASRSFLQRQLLNSEPAVLPKRYILTRGCSIAQAATRLAWVSPTGSFSKRPRRRRIRNVMNRAFVLDLIVGSGSGEVASLGYQETGTFGRRSHRTTCHTPQAREYHLEGCRRRLSSGLVV